MSARPPWCEDVVESGGRDEPDEEGRPGVGEAGDGRLAPGEQEPPSPAALHLQLNATYVLPTPVIHCLLSRRASAPTLSPLL